MTFNTIKYMEVALKLKFPNNLQNIVSDAMFCIATYYQSIEYKKNILKFQKALSEAFKTDVGQHNAEEIIVQFFITKPIFKMLFPDYCFKNKSNVYMALANVTNFLIENGFEIKNDSLADFNLCLGENIKTINTMAKKHGVICKQNLINDLYENFFKKAFPRQTEAFGIVYTPVEVVDFMLRSIEDILQNEFGETLSSKNVRFLDPFAGTGIFVARLLQSGLIDQEDYVRKYKNEILCYELCFLMQMVANANIEQTCYEVTNKKIPYNNILLTDTFQM